MITCVLEEDLHGETLSHTSKVWDSTGFSTTRSRGALSYAGIEIEDTVSRAA